jgi:hypothetical protein
MAEFRAFPKVPRLTNLSMVITEKIDGTNACVVVSEDGEVSAQSRTRAIQPGNDNFGFALWVQQNQDQLRELGPGYHFGEWWGLGIQRGYDLHERRFSLFNVTRWRDAHPDCCHVVPVLDEGTMLSALHIDAIAAELQESGSQAAPGFWKPEGVMVYVDGMNQYIKHPFDPAPKGGR